MQAIRSPLRRVALQARLPVVRPRVARPFSTAPEAKSNTTLYLGIAAAVLAGGGYWAYTSSSDTAREVGTVAKSATQAAKAATNFVPSKADYQKVYNRIAETLDEAGEYDGKAHFFFYPQKLNSHPIARWIVWTRPRSSCLAFIWYL